MAVKIPVPVQPQREFKLVPAGAHFARCVQVIDLGAQETTWQGKVKQQRKVYLKFEVPDERIEWQDRDGNAHEGPMTIGATYTLSLSEKAKLPRDLENWRGKGFTDAEIADFDVGSLLGRFCQVVVTHEDGKDGRTYANLSGIMGLSKDQRARTEGYKSETDLLIYSPEYEDPAGVGAAPVPGARRRTRRVGRRRGGRPRRDSRSPTRWRGAGTASRSTSARRVWEGCSSTGSRSTGSPSGSSGRRSLGILDLGVEDRTGVAVGRDVSLEELRSRHAALFVAIGAHVGRRLGVPGDDAPGVIAGTEFLAALNEGLPPALGARVVVVGGGNTAMDAARAARRLGAQVVVVYRRSRAEMPAIAEEVDEALSRRAPSPRRWCWRTPPPRGRGGRRRTR